MNQAVLVLDQVPQTLAVVRSLARAGYRVVLGRDRRQPPSHVEFSRCRHEVWLHPPLTEPDAFDDALQALLERRPDIRTVFPVAEPGMQALLEGRGCWRRQGVAVAMVSKALFLACRDKVEGNALAEQAGLYVPQSVVVEDPATLARAAGEIGFPVIVKSRGYRRIHGRKAYVVHSRAELESTFAAWPPDHPDLLVQRYVTGPLASCDFVAANGRLIGYCEARVVRTDMPDGTGFAVDFESIPPTADLRDVATRFVSTLGYSGPGLLQCIRSADDGALYFLENNPRLAAGVAHSIDCGQDLPRLVVEAAAGCPASDAGNSVSDADYRCGYRAHWLMRDLQGLLARRADLSLAAQCRWLLALIRSSVRAHGHITWKWHDPGPTLVIYGRFLRHRLSRWLTRGAGE